MDLLIDIHSHLDHCYFNDDRAKVVENAKKVGVKVIIESGINPETHAYNRVLPSTVPLPVAVESGHGGAAPQPRTTQIGQLPTQEPDVQVRIVSASVNPGSHVYVRVLPSAVPLPDIVAFEHV